MGESKEDVFKLTHFSILDHGRHADKGITISPRQMPVVKFFSLGLTTRKLLWSSEHFL